MNIIGGAVLFIGMFLIGFASPFSFHNLILTILGAILIIIGTAVWTTSMVIKSYDKEQIGKK